MGIELPFHVPFLLMYHLQQLFTEQEINNNIINISNDHNGYHRSTVGTPSLTIDIVTTDINGIYTCYAINAAGTGLCNPTTLAKSGVGHVNSQVTPQR